MAVKKSKSKSIRPKFNIGDRFRITDDYLKLMCVTKEDVFRVDAIHIDSEGIFYEYRKFPVRENRKFNYHKLNDRVAEFIMVRV